MDPNDRVAGILDAAGTFVSNVGSKVSGPWGIAAVAAGAALGVTADMFRAGTMTTTKVTRIRDPKDMLAAMHEHFVLSAARRPS